VTGALWLEVCDWPDGGSVGAVLPPDCCCVLLWLVLFSLVADPTAEASLCCVALPPEATFVADWVEVEEDVAVCWVGASWTIDCDCPPSPLCVAVALCVVLLSLWADEEALEELTCSALLPGSVESAAAVHGEKPVQIASKMVHASNAKQRPGPSPMSSKIADRP
jgi:hypothetical protein